MELADSILCLLFLITGIVIGTLSYIFMQKIRLKSLKKISADILKNAEREAEGLRKSAEVELRNKQIDLEKQFERELNKEKKKLLEHEERIKQREDKLENRMTLVEKKLLDTERREAILLAKKEKIDEDKKWNEDKKLEIINELEKLSGLSANEAKDLLLQKTHAEVKTESANFIRKTIKEAEEEAEREANKIVASAINRLNVSCISEYTINTVTLPNEEMKGRIIGREGRNIRALERATGINFIIDETPNAVVLSGFDPLRLHVAKLTLTELVNDGRIHPTRIDEAVEKSKILAKKQIKQYGEDAALRAGIMNLHPELVLLLGKLKFRYSYGQNVLEHSLEVSHLMGLMAGELGLDIARAKRIGLLHDMGKAVSHEIEGTHAIIGHNLALKYGETIEVANGIGCHHFEMDPLTIEASLITSADRFSAARLGARSEAAEECIKRIKKLEDLANQFPGVEKAFALQAGRELRIFVFPDIIDDDGVINLARDLSKRIERDLSYSGKIKVSVTREKCFVEYAM